MTPTNTEREQRCWRVIPFEAEGGIEEISDSMWKVINEFLDSHPNTRARHFDVLHSDKKYIKGFIFFEVITKGSYESTKTVMPDKIRDKKTR